MKSKAGKITQSKQKSANPADNRRHCGFDTNLSSWFSLIFLDGLDIFLQLYVAREDFVFRIEVSGIGFNSFDLFSGRSEGNNEA